MIMSYVKVAEGPPSDIVVLTLVISNFGQIAGSELCVWYSFVHVVRSED